MPVQRTGEKEYRVNIYLKAPPKTHAEDVAAKIKSLD